MQSVNDLIEMFNNNYGKTLNKLSEEYDKLCKLLTYEEVLLDKKLFLSYEKQKNKLEPVILEYVKMNTRINEIKELKKLLDEIPDNEQSIYYAEIEAAVENFKLETEKLFKLLNQYGAKQEYVILEIVANNAETNLLYNDILKGYSSFCAKNDLTFRLEKSDKNSFKVSASGLNAYKLFSSEIGVHNLVLKNGQTNTCNVFVCEGVAPAHNSFVFNEKDVEFKATRSSSAGGQHVNTTDSSIRATHLPTGISVVCEDERSQLQNKVRALENLKQRVSETFEEKFKLEIEKQKKEQIKKIKNNYVVKTYFKDENKIVKSDKSEILYNEFLNGNIL